MSHIVYLVSLGYFVRLLLRFALGSLGGMLLELFISPPEMLFGTAATGAAAFGATVGAAIGAAMGAAFAAAVGAPSGAAVGAALGAAVGAAFDTAELTAFEVATGAVFVATSCGAVTRGGSAAALAGVCLARGTERYLA
jgi:hypothetical protein